MWPCALPAVRCCCATAPACVAEALTEKLAGLPSGKPTCIYTDSLGSGKLCQHTYLGPTDSHRMAANDARVQCSTRPLRALHLKRRITPNNSGTFVSEDEDLPEDHWRIIHRTMTVQTALNKSRTLEHIPGIAATCWDAQLYILAGKVSYRLQPCRKQTCIGLTNLPLGTHCTLPMWPPHVVSLWLQGPWPSLKVRVILYRACSEARKVVAHASRRVVDGTARPREGPVKCSGPWEPVCSHCKPL